MCYRNQVLFFQWIRKILKVTYSTVSTFTQNTAISPILQRIMNLNWRSMKKWSRDRTKISKMIVISILFGNNLSNTYHSSHVFIICGHFKSRSPVGAFICIWLWCYRCWLTPKIANSINSKLEFSLRFMLSCLLYLCGVCLYLVGLDSCYRFPQSTTVMPSECTRKKGNWNEKERE